MGLSISGAVPGAALVPISNTTVTVAESVGPVASDKPAPDRGFDANARRAASGLAAALLLGRGGTAGPATPQDAAASKPNLDALNRVLAHYLAQSQAAARLGR